MDWRAWLNGLGLHVPASPNVDAIVIAIVLVAGAYAIGWLVAGWVAPRIIAALARWAGRLEGITLRLVCVVTRYGIASLLLLIVGNSTALSPIGLMIIATALGLALAILVFHIGKSAGLGSAVASVIAGIALLASTAGTLGGMQPLIEGLRNVGFNVGTRRFSLLGVINSIVVVVVLFCFDASVLKNENNISELNYDDHCTKLKV